MRELEVAIEAAHAAGALMRDSLRGPRQIEFKGIINMVTEIDRRAEQIIRGIVERSHPDYGFLSEEGDLQNAATRHETEDKPCWIVDPLDGTSNYVHGYPLFAVSIGLQVGTEIVAAVVYNPLQDELFTAVRGEGAQLNGTPIQVSRTPNLGHSLVASGFPYDAWTSDDDNCRQWRSVLKRVTSLRSDGSATIDLCHVAAGRLDGYWELDLDPWDMAAGSLIVREGGGVVSGVSGGPLEIHGRDILASNGLIHTAMIEALEAGARQWGTIPAGENR